MRARTAIYPALAALLVFGGGQAHAQTTGGQAALDEVVVTAQRRSERAIDVPQTVNLVSEKRLERAGVTDSVSLAEVVPGLSIVPQGFAWQPTIRGVGSTVSTVGVSGTVATYIDGVYQLAMGGNKFELANIDKVEVLKGPQGTLYGRNATGGVILVTTKDPAFSVAGQAKASVGNLGYYAADAYVTGPITDQIAGNLSAYYKQRNGYHHDIVRNVTVGDLEGYGFRGKLLFHLNENARVIAALTHTQDSDPTSFAAGPLNGNSLARRTPGAIIPTGPYNIAITFDPIIKNLYSQGSVTAEFGNDNVLVRSITAANFNKTKFFADVDASYLPLVPFGNRQEIDERVFSQELTASSTGENRLDWIGGLLFVHEKGSYDPYVSNPAAPVTTDTISNSYSAFGELTYRFTDRLKLIAGTRYTQEEKNYSGARNGVAAVTDDNTVGEWTPRVSLNYKVTDRANVYATYSKGFRSGGWNASVLSKVGYRPEYVSAYEMGAKYSARNMSLSGAVYYYDFSDIQFSASTVTTAGSTTTIVNAASAEIKGAELNADWAVTSHFFLQGGLAYTDATYDSFPGAIMTTPDPRGGNVQFVGDASGNTMIRTPKWTANLNATYQTDLSVGELVVSGNLSYRGSQFRDVANRIEDDPLTLLNARASFRPTGRPYQVEVWAKNLTDEAYWAVVIDSSISDRVTWAAPRTYGVTLSVDF